MKYANFQDQHAWQSKRSQAVRLSEVDVMPNREFLETYPLYRKCRMAIPATLNQVKKPPIHMECHLCSSAQTFNMEGNYYDWFPHRESPTRGALVLVVYVCTACHSFRRCFLLKFADDSSYVMKVGQQPSWDITLDRVLQKELGAYADYYKKALICESQSYGIGAFVYYRRVVEEIIDRLLADIPDLMTGSERDQYLEALKSVKDAKLAEDKIKLVKDLLPPILRPQGGNPLSTLYDALSEGLHSQSDERCMELAEQVRVVLVFLVNQIAATKTAGSQFTEGMRRLLERKKPEKNRSSSD